MSETSYAWSHNPDPELSPTVEDVISEILECYPDSHGDMCFPGGEDLPEETKLVDLFDPTREDSFELEVRAVEEERGGGGRGREKKEEGWHLGKESKRKEVSHKKKLSFFLDEITPQPK
jgi:hypothetical protein